MTQLDFTLSEELKQRMVQKVSYDTDARVIIIKFKGKSIRVFTYPEYPEKTMKIFDEQVNGIMNQESKQLTKSAIIDQWDKYICNFKDKSNGNDNESEAEKGDQTIPELVLELAKKYCVKLFVDEYQVAHAAVSVSDHLETLSLKSRRFRNWLARMLYKEFKLVVGSQALQDVIGILSAEAEFDGGIPIKLGLRVAARTSSDNNSTNHNDDTNCDDLTYWYYDLTNEKSEFVELTPDGWKIVNNLIIFRRYTNQQPQVYPSRDYQSDIFDAFMNLINVKGEENKLLLKCYIVSLFVPDIPKPILMLHGEQGSAKSTTMELIKMLVDPSVIRTLTFPRDINELIQQLSHSYIAYYDNVSTVREWISDQLCRGVTGSGFSKRALFTDDDDYIYNLKRAIGFNGINLGATKADLLDRGIIIQLDRVEKKNKRKLEAIWREFETIRPQLLGYFFDILVKVVKAKFARKLNLEELPRMADFGEYGELISRCMGNPENAFLEAYYKNINLQTEEVLEASLVAVAVRYFMLSRNEWRGTASELLAQLDACVEYVKINIKSKSWPKSPNYLSRRLNEVRTNLREIGIFVKWSTDSSKTRIIRISKVSPVSGMSPEDPNQQQLFPIYSGDEPNGIDGI